MEEVDGIILEALNNINCELDESVHSLRDIDSETVFHCIVCCLKLITPTIKFPNKLPPSMSLRLKLATTIAEHIKELGYRGDMGYQTILYCNEVEIRRVLIFLVEHLPREVTKTSATEELGYVPKLVKEIKKRLQLNFEMTWVPSGYLNYGGRDFGGDIYLRQDFGHCHPLQTENLQVSHGLDISSEVNKQYWVHLPDVTQQCSAKNLIPSLLFKDTEFSSGLESVDFVNAEHENVIENEVSEHIKVLQTNVNNVEQTKFDTNVQTLMTEIKESKAKLEELQSKRKTREAKLTQIYDEKSKKEAIVKEIIAKIKTRSKTLTVLSSEENMAKLKNLVQNGTNRLMELANQWNEVQAPLSTEYKQIKERLAVQTAELLDAVHKLENTKTKSKQLELDMKEKDILQQELMQEYEKLSKNTSRSAYTQRILEIIGNIQKQNEEINKTLNDTKSVQKEINNLNGQLDRSFAVSDELIFRDAKRDEMARKTYKLLATLHTSCSELVQAVTDLGSTERDCRNLQEQVDAESARETSAKLVRVNADIAEIRKETALLTKNLKEQT